MTTRNAAATGKTVLGGEDAPRSRFALKTKPANILSEEVAHDQVMDLLSYYDIDPDRQTDAKPEEVSTFERALLQLRDYIQRGALDVGRDKDGRIEVTQTLASGDTIIKYGEIKAKHKVAMETCDPKAGYSRIYAFMGAVSGLGKAGIEKLAPRDLAVVEVLGMVFLAA